MVAHDVLCAWRPIDSGPLHDSPTGWSYDAGDHGRLRPGGGPPAPPAPLVRQGTSVLRLREAPRGRDERGLQPAPKGPATGDVLYTPRFSHARHRGDGGVGRCGARGGSPARGSPGGPPARRPCEKPSPDPGPPEEYASYALRVLHDPLEHLQRSPPNVGRLRGATANSGGLGSDPRKVPRLIAYLACAEPDDAHL